ncbi:MAG: multidrug efflux SMR transporter [Pseudomonadota bacterium]
MAKLYLALAIISEVIASSALKASDGMTKIGPAALVVVGYGTSFYLLALVLRDIPIGIAYAIWAGLGIVLITAIGAVVFRQTPDLPAVIGIALIVAGVVVLNLFSKMEAH